MNNFKKIIISLERILSTFFSLILLAFIFSKFGVPDVYTFFSLVVIFEWPSIFTPLLSPELSIFLYYLLLFLIPIVGLSICKTKHLKLHIYFFCILALLLLAHLHLFYSLLGT